MKIEGIQRRSEDRKLNQADQSPIQSSAGNNRIWTDRNITH